MIIQIIIMDLHHIMMISAPGLVLFLLSTLFIAKCFQISQGSTCMACVFEGLDHATQAELINRGCQTTRDPNCASISDRETRFA